MHPEAVTAAMNYTQESCQPLGCERLTNGKMTVIKIPDSTFQGDTTSDELKQDVSSEPAISLESTEFARDTLTPAQLAEQLSEAMLRASFGDASDVLGIPRELLMGSGGHANDVEERTRHELSLELAELSALANGSLSELGAAWLERHDSLDRLLANSLVFIERICTQWSAQIGLDETVRSALLKRRFVFAALLIDQPEFILDPKHPVASLLSFVERLFEGWESSQGSAPGFVTRAFERLQRLLDNGKVLQSSEQIDALATVRREWEREQKRRGMLEQRLIDSETGQDNSLQAEALVALRLNSVASHFELPEVIRSFLQGPWRDSMTLTCLQHGAGSRQFRDMHVLCDRIVFAFRNLENDAQKQQLFAFASALSDEVGRRLESLGNDEPKRQQVMADFEAALQSNLRGNAVDRVAWSSLEIPIQLNEVDDEHDVRAESLMKSLGSGFFRRGERLCKALVLLPHQRVVVWSDAAGRKVFSEPVAALLQENEASLLTPAVASRPLPLIARRVAIATIDAYLGQKTAAAKRFAEAKAQRDLARQKAEEEAAAIVAARAEALAQAAEEKAIAAQQLAQAELDAEARQALENLQTAREQIDGIHLGGTVQIRKNGVMVGGKLAVRLNASGKLIFVNDLGLKLEEILRDDAVQRLLSGDIIIRDAGQAFEARLARAVGRIGVRN